VGVLELNRNPENYDAEADKAMQKAHQLSQGGYDDRAVTGEAGPNFECCGYPNPRHSNWSANLPPLPPDIVIHAHFHADIETLPYHDLHDRAYRYDEGMTAIPLA
jgi:hypothetical protein